MKSNKPTMARREFLSTASKKLPQWFMIFSAISSGKILAAEDDGYNPKDHDYAMGISIHK